ncbi:MAG: phosphoglucosamine mutase [Dehalococcoidia bacterium]|nr:MAG: phosphoglucosamine mutase [Dehalococcoidia bacterium]
MKLFGSSGIRRVVDREFLQLVFDIGLATGSSYRSLLVGNDTRTSSEAVRYALLSGLLSGGAEVACAGVIPTPTLAYAARHFEAGAMITASHNPPQYNGVKLVNPDGSAFDPAQRSQIEQLVAEGSAQTAQWEQIKQCTDYVEAIEEHVERIRADFPGRIGVKVVVDCVCGAASEVTPILLGRLGCEVIPLNCSPSGFFPREIEPIPENLDELMQAVKSENADLGIAHDGDGDRIAVIDDKGRFVLADRLMALFARELGARKVVTTVDASMLIDELGFEVMRTKVGDAYVSDELRRNPRADSLNEFGGESSGCFIFPHISLCPDAIYGAARVARMASEQPISTLVEQLPSYPVLRGGIPGEPAIMEDVERRLKNESASGGGTLEAIDGLRLAFSDGWLLIRPSCTEPKIRITAEATSEHRARELYELGTRTIKECLLAKERATG